MATNDVEQLTPTSTPTKVTPTKVTPTKVTPTRHGYHSLSGEEEEFLDATSITSESKSRCQVSGARV